MQRNSQSRFMSEINVVPLVDVVLVLLIIFMITAPLLNRGVEVDLPVSAVNTIQPDERIILTVNAQQKVFLEQNEISLSELRTALARRAEEKPGVSVSLKADGKVPYGMVIQVMDVVKQAGIDQLGMVTDPPPA